MQFEYILINPYTMKKLFKFIKKILYYENYEYERLKKFLQR